MFKPKFFFFIVLLIPFSCSEDEVTRGFRPKLNYSLLTNETPYTELFVDANDETTVNLQEGNTLHKMFQAINYYSTSSVSANTHIDAAKLNLMFVNAGDRFTDISTSTISVVGADLNSSLHQLKSVVASSHSVEDAEVVRNRFESLFSQIDVASNSINSTALSGSAGKLGSYLVDEKGIEIAQVIQKSLIGALQLDYIGNVLFTDGLNANNTELVEGENYTQLEHNWDIAYGLLTLNPIYLEGWTSDTKSSTIFEFAAGSYIWEYNKANYANIYPAFLKGRAAIVNNDKAELKKQATFIRTEFEKTIANAAIGYLEKWKTGGTDAARAHAIGEGLGFIYSLRFATLHGADDEFSEAILTGLINSPNGFWDLTVNKINTAEDAIKAKFNL